MSYIIVLTHCTFTETILNMLQWLEYEYNEILSVVYDNIHTVKMVLLYPIWEYEYINPLTAAGLFVNLFILYL